MSTEISTAQSTTLNALKSLGGSLRRMQADVPTRGAEAYTAFGRDGLWSFGKERKSINPERDTLLVNIRSFESGFVAWTRHDADTKLPNEKMGEVMARVGGPPVSLANLPEHHDKFGKRVEWQRQMGFVAKFIEGPHTGTQVQTTFSSMGGLDAIGALLDAVIARVEDEGVYVYPLIALGSSSYVHRTWGKIYTPVFDIVGWADEDGNPEGAQAEALPPPEPVQEPTPRRRVRG